MNLSLQLEAIINSKQVKATIYKMSYKFSVLDKEDVQGEFYRGMLMGLQDVNPNIGDPVQYLIKRGVWQVKTQIRKELGDRIIQNCTVCNQTNARYAYSRTCERCHESVENTSKYEDISPIDVGGQEKSQETISLKVSKPLSTHQQRILELLVQACLDGIEHPQVEVARILGVSRARVNQHLQKIRPYLDLTQS